MDDGSLSNPEGGNDHRWVTILTAGAVIAASLYLRINIQGRKLKVSDYFLCLAWCSAVATASFDIQFTVMGALHQNVKINLDGFSGSDDDTMLVMRIGVYCTFGLGIINMTFSLVRFITIQTAPVEALPFGLVELWSELDVNIGLLVASLPSLRPYFRSSRGVGYSDKSNGYNYMSTVKTPMHITRMSRFDVTVPPNFGQPVDLEHVAEGSSTTKSQNSDMDLSDAGSVVTGDNTDTSLHST
ncbi:hypothetical protein CSHISOI_08215 [Colletotrichum shisoi]|uniref:Rhodopsin domain-containing protein n=1 Tax=Colletotrichum shisoi TaxID=2078593 RepID=A0A5Q4BJV2_9PEZI|nr:hypothetical protein CSHISOI_08215 [Colletotrichum shisoi]